MAATSIMRNWIAITTSLFVALILTLLPLPLLIQWARPAWVLLCLLYWTMTLPMHVGVGIAWLMGIVVDVLTGTLIGEHAAAYTFVMYCMVRMQFKFKQCGLVQQALAIFLLFTVYRLVLYGIQGFSGELSSNSAYYWLTILTSTVVWPVIVFLFHRK